MEAIAKQARQLLADGAAEEAAMVLRRAVEHCPDWALGFFLLGRAEALLDQHDQSACSFRRARNLGSVSLRKAARENEELIAGRFLPRHTLLWLNDGIRASSWRAALLATEGIAGAAVLCAGETACAAALHAALALEAGARQADAVVGSAYVATAAASFAECQRVYAHLEDLPLLSTKYSILCHDFGNRFSGDSVAALRDAAMLCSTAVRILPSRVMIRACIVESPQLAELNACTCVNAGSHQFPLRAFNEMFSRKQRTVQLQAASLQWRPLTAPFTLLDCRVPELIASPEVKTESVSAKVLSCGKGHAVVTWLDCELTPGYWLSTGAEPTNAAAMHATQTAHFAPAGAPWVLADGEDVSLRATLTSCGVELMFANNAHSFAIAAPASQSIPDYHFAMLNDRARNDAYAAGIRTALADLRSRSTASLRVLDVGAGAGLLSLIAAGEGGGEVIACERNASLASSAALDIADNGHADTVAIAATHSSSLCCDNVGTFDLIVSEILGSDPLSEGILGAMLHAQTLLSPNGVILPPNIELIAALLSCGSQLGPMLGAQPPVQDSLRTLRTAFASIAPLRTSCHLPDVPGAMLLSEAASFTIDLSTVPLPQSGVLSAQTTVTVDGEADAILLWFKVCFDGSAVATGPHDGWRSHWPQTALAIPAHRLSAGEKVSLELEYSGDRTMIRIRD